MNDSSKMIIDWKDYIDMVNILIYKVKKAYMDYTILAVARGGLFPATMITYQTEINMDIARISTYTTKNKLTSVKLHSYPWKKNNQPNKILIVDDLIDSGTTLNYLINKIKTNIGEFSLIENYDIKTAVLIDKGQSTFKPDFVVLPLKINSWVEFPYETKLKDLK